MEILDSAIRALNSSLQETSLRSFWATSCGDLADFGHCADSSPALRPKSATQRVAKQKRSTTSTAIRRICERSETTNTRICDFNQGDSSDLKNSPSLAEGVRGWVKTHSLDSANQNIRHYEQIFDLRGNPPIKKKRRIKVDGCFTSFANPSDCHARFTLARNDELI